MTFVDLWAASAAAIAAAFLALRGNMLKPDRDAWAPAPWPVWVAIMGLAIALGMAATTIITGDHATPREALIYTVEALVSAVMALNLHRTGRGSNARLLAQLHGRAGLIRTIEARLDPETRARFAKAIETARADAHAAKGRVPR